MVGGIDHIPLTDMFKFLNYPLSIQLNYADRCDSVMGNNDPLHKFCNG